MVDVVLDVQSKEARHGVRFIHVEIYKDNDPAKGENRWVREWHLPSEPLEINEITGDVLHRFTARADQVMMRFQIAIDAQGG